MVSYAAENERLNSLLKLSTHPVAVKYLDRFDEETEWELAEAGFYKPRTPLNLCQFVGLARHHSRSVIATADNLACKIGSLTVGMHPFDDEMSEGRIAILDGARRDEALCREMFRTLPRMEAGSIKAIAFAPLSKMNLDLDQVIFYGNPLETLRIMQAYLWGNGARLEVSTCSKYGVCAEGMAISHVTMMPSVGFPCRGERASSIVQDDELFFCLPGKFLGDLLEGLERTKHLLPTPMPFNGVGQFPDFLPDYYLTDQAKSKGKGA